MEEAELLSKFTVESVRAMYKKMNRVPIQGDMVRGMGDGTLGSCILGILREFGVQSTDRYGEKRYLTSSCADDQLRALEYGWEGWDHDDRVAGLPAWQRGRELARALLSCD